jgi:hypothetical protein
MAKENVIKIFTMPQKFPCGEGSSCCGPIGQTEAGTKSLKDHLSRNIPGAKVEVYNVVDGVQMKRERGMLTMLRNFGWGVLPIIAVNDEPVSMGAPDLKEAVNLIKSKLEG